MTFPDDQSSVPGAPPATVAGSSSFSPAISLATRSRSAATADPGSTATNRREYSSPLAASPLYRDAVASMRSRTGSSGESRSASSSTAAALP